MAKGALLVRGRRVAGALAVVVVLALGSVGCGDEEPPAPSATSVVSPKKGPALTGTESSSPTSGAGRSSAGAKTSAGDGDVPGLPEAAKKNTKAGAEAFAMFYTTQLGESAATADSTTIRALADKSCDVCDALADQADLYAKEGVRAPRSPYRNLRIASSRAAGGGTHVVEVNMDQASFRLIDKSGTPGTKVGGEKDVSYFVSVDWEDGRWITRDLVVGVYS